MLASSSQTHQPANAAQTNRSQDSSRESVAIFDDLGLLVHDCDTTDPSDKVIFKMLEMKALLASAFQLQGFESAKAIAPHHPNLMVEFQKREKCYTSFKSQ